MAEQVKMPSNSLETSPRLTAPEDPEEAVGAPGWEAENGEGVHGVLGFCAAGTRHPGHRQGLCQASGCSHARLQGSNALALMPVFPERNIEPSGLGRHGVCIRCIEWGREARARVGLRAYRRQSGASHALAEHLRGRGQELC